MGVYQFAAKNGIPEESCQIYTAKNPDHFDCSARQQCLNCEPGGNCYEIPEGKFPRWFVDEYGSVSGADKMKAEIYARGPIGCGIDATE